MSGIRRFGVVAFVAVMLPAALRAQATGTIAGQVVAAEGRPIAGAQISVTGTLRGAVADQQGRYTITAVPAGAQRVRAKDCTSARLSRSTVVGSPSTVRPYVAPGA